MKEDLKKEIQMLKEVNAIETIESRYKIEIKMLKEEFSLR